MPIKKLSHGHYCKVCGQYKANEEFSRKGYAIHICRVCSGLPAAKKTEAIVINKLLSLPIGKLSESEIKWLKSCTQDKNPEVAGLAQEIYWQHFPYAERYAMKKQLIIDRLMFEIQGKVWDGYGGYEMVSKCFTISRKEETITLQDFDKKEPDRKVALGRSRMAKLLKWTVNTQEIFMWPQYYGLHSTGYAFSDMLPKFLSDDYDMKDWNDGLGEVEDKDSEQQEGAWKVKIEYTNGSEQEIYGDGYGLPEKAEELYYALSEYFEPEETEGD